MLVGAIQLISSLIIGFPLFRFSNLFHPHGILFRLIEFVIYLKRETSLGIWRNWRVFLTRWIWITYWNSSYWEFHWRVNNMDVRRPGCIFGEICLMVLVWHVFFETQLDSIRFICNAWTLEKGLVTFTPPLPGLQFGYDEHFGIEYLQKIILLIEVFWWTLGVPFTLTNWKEWSIVYSCVRSSMWCGG